MLLVTIYRACPPKAELAVYDLLGKKVATLAQGLQLPGSHAYFWNALDFSSGVYLFRLETENGGAVERVSVVK